MSDDFLSDLAGKAAKDTGSKSPFARIEKTRPVQIRENQYLKIKEIAFHQDKKIVDVVEGLLETGLDALNTDENN